MPGNNTKGKTTNPPNIPPNKTNASNLSIGGVNIGQLQSMVGGMGGQIQQITQAVNSHALDIKSCIETNKLADKDRSLLWKEQEYLEKKVDDLISKVAGLSQIIVDLSNKINKKE